MRRTIRVLAVSVVLVLALAIPALADAPLTGANDCWGDLESLDLPPQYLGQVADSVDPQALSGEDIESITGILTNYCGDNR